MQYLLIQSKLFSKEIPDDQIGEWFLGGDLAGWLYMKLLPGERIQHGLGPCMEDWGWYLSVECDKLEVAFYIWDHFDDDAGWVVGIEVKQRLFKKATPDIVDEIQEYVVSWLDKSIEAAEHIDNYEWMDENPLD